ncbi:MULTISPECIES: Lrp/AsnC family transcriptional regulator [Stappia]|jgi:Lrp/AsnC family transcriptional regulator|uniref:Transcriptional regulator, AsnC family n=1 Tax=Stappia indica TaxID=538381 RepID=A0A285RNS8_9HYPH|nr:MULTISPECIES: Lrp/AsnC family transcriptional regulator [Stappia]MBC2859195.1 Lrp/AsnC family transcriptional regulator [Stappia sp. 28M-7]QGZ37118.1 winged helix-turn-helix transcriptional regulator [Stappia indica]SOB95736.1 transcriptional regulator, AsnC family [Stappia indica]
MQPLDETDLKILRVLQQDGSLSVTEVAERVGLSQSPCSRRINRMIEDKVILGRSIILDRRKLGFDATILVRIKLSGHGRQSISVFQEAALKIPEIQVVQLMLGEFDFNLRVVVRDMDHFQTLLREKLVMLPGLHEIQSTVILEETKYTTHLPI